MSELAAQSDRLDKARHALHRRLARQVQRFPDLDIAPISDEGLDARDAAFAHALDDIITRRWITLEWLLQRALTRPFDQLEPKVRAVLLAGAAQLLFTYKVPAHAAVNESVAWAKQFVRAGAGGLVNAALRTLQALIATDRRRDRWTDRRDELPLADGAALVLTGEILPTDPLERLAIATSHPVELLRRWSAQMPDSDVRRIALRALAHAPVILNTAHVRSPLPADAPVTPHDAPGHHVFRGTRDELLALLASRDDLWVQDPASALAVRSVADLRPRVVIDLCAGRGTKTKQLRWTFPDALIVATDIDPARQRALAETFRDWKGPPGAGRVEVVFYRDLRDPQKWNGRADLVLIDAPCSNTAVLARRVEARYRAADERIAELADIQRQAIADSIPLLAPSGPQGRGRILYSTCSLDPRENEAQAEWAARWHGFASSRAQRTLPAGALADPPERLTDGAYSVLLG